MRYAVEMAAGVVLLTGAVLTWWRRAALARRLLPRATRPGRSGFVLGASIMAVELPTAFPYFGAVAAIVGANVDDGEQLLLLVIFNLVFVAPLVAIALVLAAGQERAQRMLDRSRRLLERHWPRALAWLLGVVGAVVVPLGASGLVSQGGTSLAHSVGHLRRVLTRP